MVTFVIGGKEYLAPPLTFKRLKKVWPDVRQTLEQINGPAKTTDDDMVQAGFASVEVACRIVAVALEPSFPEMTAAVIEDTLVPKETALLSASLQDLMIEAGLVTSGPQMPAAGGVVSPSTATGTQSSQNSLQPESKAEAGTP